MVDFYDIYLHHGAAYQAMIAAEDFQDNLATSLHQIIPPASKTLLDLGSGTGRLPRILANDFEQITALDLHRNMLLQQQAEKNLSIIQGDMRMLPIPHHQFDVVSAGWAIGHLTGWYPDNWQEHVSMVLHEMQRTVKPGGVIIIMETMSTGATQPAPPVPWLATLYDWFESAWGLQRQVIPTDYLFASVEQAKSLTGFFFGEELVDQIEKNQWQQLPEWTGIWWKKA
jgi:ubiquinone/menaquinone biosynthesis C-methylase UbiE